MAKNSTLEELIFDIDYMAKNFDAIMKEKYDNIMAMIIVAIGKATAYDTGVTRDLIKGILGELGRDDLGNQLEHKVYEFWKTKEERNKDNSSYSFKQVNGRYNISIIDYGFGNQQDGKVSTIHPRNDNKVVGRQVDYGFDLMETGTDVGIEKAFNDLEDYVVRALDGDF